MLSDLCEQVCDRNAERSSFQRRELEGSRRSLNVPQRLTKELGSFVLLCRAVLNDSTDGHPLPTLALDEDAMRRRIANVQRRRIDLDREFVSVDRTVPFPGEILRENLSRDLGSRELSDLGIVQLTETNGRPIAPLVNLMSRGKNRREECNE